MRGYVSWKPLTHSALQCAPTPSLTLSTAPRGAAALSDTSLKNTSLPSTWSKFVSSVPPAPNQANKRESVNIWHVYVNRPLWWNKASGGSRQPLSLALGQQCPKSYLSHWPFPAPSSSPQLKAQPVPGSWQTWTQSSNILLGCTTSLPT